MATATRTNENGHEFSLFKTPLRTPMRNGMLSSATLNDLASYSNGNQNKHLRFVTASSMNDIHACHQTATTPIHMNRAKFGTPNSVKCRRALGPVNHNSTQLAHPLSTDDSVNLVPSKPLYSDKYDESLVGQKVNAETDEELPHQGNSINSYLDDFDDLMPNDERIERLVRHIEGGVNLFTFYGGVENSVRCQSPAHNRLNVPTLLDMLDMFN